MRIARGPEPPVNGQWAARPDFSSKKKCANRPRTMAVATQRKTSPGAIATASDAPRREPAAMIPVCRMSPVIASLPKTCAFVQRRTGLYDKFSSRAAGGKWGSLRSGAQVAGIGAGNGDSNRHRNPGVCPKSASSKSRTVWSLGPQDATMVPGKAVARGFATKGHFGRLPYDGPPSPSRLAIPERRARRPIVRVGLPLGRSVAQLTMPLGTSGGVVLRLTIDSKCGGPLEFPGQRLVEPTAVGEWPKFYRRCRAR